MKEQQTSQAFASSLVRFDDIPMFGVQGRTLWQESCGSSHADAELHAVGFLWECCNPCLHGLPDCFRAAQSAETLSPTFLLKVGLEQLRRSRNFGSLRVSSGCTGPLCEKCRSLHGHCCC